MQEWISRSVMLHGERYHRNAVQYHVWEMLPSALLILCKFQLVIPVVQQSRKMLAVCGAPSLMRPSHASDAGVKLPSKMLFCCFREVMAGIEVIPLRSFPDFFAAITGLYAYDCIVADNQNKHKIPDSTFMWFFCTVRLFSFRPLFTFKRSFMKIM